jgi:uncharacterized protein YndB with AHSA1/START domain
LEPLGSHTNLSLAYTFDKEPKSKYLFGDLFAYYLHAIYTTCEHDFHEPALLFDFSRSWKGNIQHVIYINANPDEIFEMLHKPEKLAMYFTNVKAFEPEEGGKIDFGWSTGPTKVLEWEDGFELAYDWPVEQDGQKHIGKVKWTLEFEGRQTRLVMKQSGFDSNVDHYRTGEALGWAVIMLEIKRIVESGRPALNMSGKIEG